jgi:hypothetical protein
MAKSTLAARRAARKQYQQATKKPLGQGSRFKAVAKSAELGGAKNPEAVAAAVGQKKYGVKKMTRMAVAGKKKK